MGERRAFNKFGGPGERLLIQNTNEINNITIVVIPAEAGIQKHVENTGFPPGWE